MAKQTQQPDPVTGDDAAGIVDDQALDTDIEDDETGAGADTDPDDDTDLDDGDFFNDDAAGDDDDDDDTDAAGQGASDDAQGDPTPDGNATGDEGAAGDEGGGEGGEGGEASGAEPDKQNAPKKVEQLNYELKNANRQIEELRQRIEGNPDGKPTEQDKSQLEQLTATLDEIESGLGDGLEYEFLDKASAKKLVGSLKQVVKQNSELANQVNELSGATRPLIQTEAQRQYWSQFDREHPPLAGDKGRQLFETVRKSIVDRGLEPGSPKYEGALEIAWENAIEQAEAAAAQTHEETPPPTRGKGKGKATPSTRSSRSTEGAVVSPRGASVAAQAAAVRDFEPDDELIDDAAFMK